MSKPRKIVAYNTKENPVSAFDKIMSGVDLLANPVKSTLGHYGRNFIIEKSGGRITNDGISIAKEIQSNDEVEDIAIRLAREALIKTNEDAGDGTTTATTLLQAILKECYQYLGKKNQLARRSVVSMKQQIEKETKEVVEKLKERAVPITTKEQLVDAVMVSVEDRDLAELIGSTQWELGANGHIVVEENPEPVCMVERVNGIRVDNGLGTSMVINDHERQRLSVENVPILLTNYVVNTLTPLVPSLTALVQSGKTDIVIVARAYSSDAIREMMENQNRGIRIYPLQAPYVNQREVMKDMQAVMGGRYIHDEESTLDSVLLEDYGFAKRVIGYRYSAIFTGSQDCSARLETLKKELEGEPSKFQRRMIEERIAQLEHGFALLKIGSSSDVDRKYKYDKAEDACNTARAALQEGTVEGAGLALKAIAEAMPDDSLLKKPLMAPYKQIMENAGGEFAVEPWVRNAVKVERIALENAAKVAGDLLTTGGAIVTENIKPLDMLLKPQQQSQDGV